MKAVWRDKLKLQNYVSGLFIEPDSREWMDDYSPATGEKIGKVPRSQKSDVDRLRKNINTTIPKDIDFKKIDGLSSELKLKLSKINPQHIHEASQIDGMTPSGLMLLISKINSYKKTA